jgi:hypothetical protein
MSKRRNCDVRDECFLLFDNRMWINDLRHFDIEKMLL